MRPPHDVPRYTCKATRVKEMVKILQGHTAEMSKAVSDNSWEAFEAA